MKILNILCDCEEVYLNEDQALRIEQLQNELEDLHIAYDDAIIDDDQLTADQILQQIYDLRDELIHLTDTGINEAAQRQFKRVGQQIVKKYRCLSGPKAGKLVSDPGKCASRKDPKKVRQGRKVMRSKKGTIARKSQISKRKSISKMVTKMNKRLAGKPQ